LKNSIKLVIVAALLIGLAYFGVEAQEHLSVGTCCDQFVVYWIDCRPLPSGAECISPFSFFSEYMGDWTLCDSGNLGNFYGYQNCTGLKVVEGCYDLFLTWNFCY